MRPTELFISQPCTSSSTSCQRGRIHHTAREFLAADTHVFRKRSFVTVWMFVKEQRVGEGKKANGEANHEGNVNPSPHFMNVFFGSVLASHEFLLESHSSTNLFHGLGLHGGFGTNLGDCLRRAALDKRQGLTSGKARSNTKRLRSSSRQNRDDAIHCVRDRGI